MGHSLVIFAAAAWLASLTTLRAAEPPQTIPTRLPTSPAEVAQFSGPDRCCRSIGRS